MYKSTTNNTFLQSLDMAIIVFRLHDVSLRLEVCCRRSRLQAVLVPNVKNYEVHSCISNTTARGRQAG